MLLIEGLLIRDFFHNLCDGVFILAAFSKCFPANFWYVASAAAAVILKVAQERSDFTITSFQCKGTLCSASVLALNFASLAELNVVVELLAVLGSGVADANAGPILAIGRQRRGI